MAFYLREIELPDLEQYLFLNNPDRKFHTLNGPYFKQRTHEELEHYIRLLEKRLRNKEKNVLENKKLIVNDNNELIGEVNWYWKSQETLWMEVGIVIFNESYWGKGIGYIALTKWIHEIFRKNPNLVRIGLSTWSGNIGMIKLSEKLGLEKEAVYKKARIVDGKYYDSISYGILREDWERIHGKI
ncbi:MAG: GNAT family protein [Candidatus Gracilibacteria bacterium]|nr:GNAT family protein [Candidatus Gracilibacteria bacterium]